MKVRKVLPYVSLLFVITLLGNCGNPFTDGQAAQNHNKGLVILHIADGNAGQRTLLPSSVFSRYTLTFTGEGKEPVTIPAADATVNIELESGSWDVTAQAYVTIQGTDYLAAKGKKTITIAAQQTIHESVSIRADNTGAEGLFSYDVRLSLDTASLSKALLVFESLGGEYKQEIDLTAEGKEKGTLAVKPGFYLLKIQLENDYQAAGKTEIVHIYTNMETKAEYVFKSADLTKLIPVSGTAQVITHGAVQTKTGLFLYSDEGLEDLIAHTEVNLSDTTWKTMIPNIYEKVYFKLVVEDETAFSFAKTAGHEAIPEIGRTGIDLNITIPEPHITSFLVTAEEAGLDSDLTGTIDENQTTIILATQKWIENIAHLKAAFVSTGTVTVNAAEQKSGITEQDFRSDIVYTVTTEDNAAKDYTVVFESPQATGLPVIKIDTQGGAAIASKETYVKTNIKIVDPNNETYSFENTGYKDEIRGRGNSTWNMPKKPYTLKLASKAELLDMPTHKRWHLLANYSDKTLLRTETAFQMGEILKDGLNWTPRSRHIQLYVNNEYQGVYQLVEAIKIDENRVDIKDITKKNPQRGYILEIDTRKGEAFNFTTTRDVIFNCSDPDEDLDELITGDTKTLFEKIQTDVQHVEDVLYSAGFTDPAEGYRKYLDVDSFVNWYLVNEITKNNDAIFHTSVFMYYDDAKQKYCMGPLWDFDISLGNYKGSVGEYTDGFHIKNAKWISRLFQDPEFVSAVKNRWNTKKSEFIALQQYIDERAEYINKAQAQNFKRWNILNVSVWPNVVVPGTYQGEIDYLKTWLADRLAWLDTAINQL